MRAMILHTFCWVCILVRASVAKTHFSLSNKRQFLVSNSSFSDMLLDCLASCTRRLTPRQERRAADHRDGVPVVPVPVPVHVPIPGPVAVVAPETVPDAAQVPAANDDPGSPEPPFQTDLCCTIDRATVTIRVTVDHSVPVNVVTIKCLKGLGRKPLRNPLPAELSDRAAMVLPGHRGWQQLTLYSPMGHRGLTRDVDLVVVDDDYPCDLLLGAEFKGVSFEPGGGLYPNHAKALDKGTCSLALPFLHGAPL